MNKLQKGFVNLLLILSLAIFVIAVLGLTAYKIKETDTSVKDVFMSDSPTEDNITDVNSCESDYECGPNKFCDYSQFGGLGPEGVIKGQVTGSMKCIPICEADSDCEKGVCATYKLIRDDAGYNPKGCKF